jgi:hypothetical protein
MAPTRLSFGLLTRSFLRPCSEYDRRPHKRKTVYTAEEIRAIKQDVEEVRRELLAGYGDRDFFGQPASAVLPQSANHTAHISSASADSLLPRRRVNELGETYVNVAACIRRFLLKKNDKDSI